MRPRGKSGKIPSFEAESINYPHVWYGGPGEHADHFHRRCELTGIHGAPQKIGEHATFLLSIVICALVVNTFSLSRALTYVVPRLLGFRQIKSPTVEIDSHVQSHLPILPMSSTFCLPLSRLLSISTESATWCSSLTAKVCLCSSASIYSLGVAVFCKSIPEIPERLILVADFMR